MEPPIKIFKDILEYGMLLQDGALLCVRNSCIAFQYRNRLKRKTKLLVITAMVYLVFSN